MKHLKPLFLILTLFASLAFTGCKGKASKAEVKKVTKKSIIRIIEAQKGSLTKKLSTTGNVLADNRVTIKATVEGPISLFPWREGDKVKAGETLVEIFRPIYSEEVNKSKASLAVAEARLADLRAGARPEEIAKAKEVVRKKEEAAKFAKADYERIKVLVKKGALPEEQAEKARVACVNCKTDLKAAREHLSMLRRGPTRTEIAVKKSLVQEAITRQALSDARFAECIIKAPFSGTIIKTFIRKGELATPRAPLLEIYDPRSIVVRFSVPEKDSGKIKVDDAIKIRTDSYPDKVFEGQISRIFPEIDKQSRTRTVEAKIANSEKLIPGMFARITMQLETKQGVIVPDEAIISTVRGEQVVYIEQNGFAKLKKVKIGIEQENSVQILSGVNEGDKVITYGNRSLKDGAVVKIQVKSKRNR
jgi:multidrug efflux pump subunit AcrA (membrane-fusion protein)